MKYKKLIAGMSLVLLALAALIVGTLLKLNKDKEVTVIKNKANVEWYDVDGTEFVITTADELLGFVQLADFYDFSGQTIKLGADIVVNEGNAKDWENKAPENRWYPINNFAGTFDGQGHSISGLYTKAYDLPLGMFANTQPGCTVKDFRLLNSYFEGSGTEGVASIASKGGGTFSQIYSSAIVKSNGMYCGGILGVMTGMTKVSECWYDGELYFHGRMTGGIVGGVTGMLEMTHCLYSGDIVNTWTMEAPGVGGLIGYMGKDISDVTMTDCLSVGSIQAESIYYVGAVTGIQYSGSICTFENIYSSIECVNTAIGYNGAQGENYGAPLELREVHLIGENGYKWTNLDFDSYWTTVAENTPVLKHFAEKAESVDGVEKVFDISWYDPYESEFVINTKEELYGLYFLSGNTDLSGATIKLGADIKVNEGDASKWRETSPENIWYPIKKFGGTIDGQGYTISGLYFKGEVDRIGLISETTTDAMIKNLKLTNSYFEKLGTKNAKMGSVFGSGGGILDTVYSDAILVSQGNIVGGLVGQVIEEGETIFTNCWYAGKLMLIDTARHGGGMVGDVAAGQVTIEHCLNTGTLTCETKDAGLHLGGLAGTAMNEGSSITFKDSLHAGLVQAEHQVCVGSVMGRIQELTEITFIDTYATTEGYLNKDKVHLGIGTQSKPAKSGGVVDYPTKLISGVGAYEWTNLDFDKYWSLQANGTPVLKSFGGNGLAVGNATKKFDTSWYQPEAQTYVIDSVKDLYGLYMISAGTDFEGKKVVLGADIVVNAGSASEWKANAPQLAWNPLKTFAGTFDGQGHTISGLYAKAELPFVGLFSKTVKTAKVQNLKLKNSYFESTMTDNVYMGSIVGRGAGLFENIYSDAILESSASIVGGIVGHMNGNEKNVLKKCQFAGRVALTNEEAIYAGGLVANIVLGDNLIEDCLVTGTVSSAAPSKGLHVGGLVGAMMNEGTVVTIKHSMNSGSLDVKYDQCVATIVGRNKNATLNLEDVYAVKEIYNRAVGTASAGIRNGDVLHIPERYISDSFGYTMTEFDFSNTWVAIKDGTPELKNFATGEVIVVNGLFRADTSWYNSAKSTYEIKDASDLFGITKLSFGKSYKQKTFVLTSNIDLKNVMWLPIGSAVAFEGTFDGKMHTIRGMYIESDQTQVGLFASVGGTVKNLRLEDGAINSTYKGNAFVGSAVGYLYGEMENVYSNASIVATGNDIGGLVGRFGGQRDGSINGCWFDGNVESSGRFVGGIVGEVNLGVKTISNCLSTGEIISTWTENNYPHVGGICGYVEQKKTDYPVVLHLEDCLSDVTISSIGTSTVGSVVGRYAGSGETLSVGTVTNVYATEESYSEAVSSNSGGVISGTNQKIVDSHFNRISREYLQGYWGYQLTGFDFESSWIAVNDSIPELKKLSAKEAIKGLNKDYIADTSWYDDEHGNSAEDAYQIKDAADLYGLAKLTLLGNNLGKKYIELTADIVINEDVNQPQVNWIPIGLEGKANFNGVFDGKGHTISGVYCVGEQNVGLFGIATYNSVIKNFQIKNSIFKSTTTADANVGSVIGAAAGTIETVKCDETVRVISSGANSGGIAGVIKTSNKSDSIPHKISNCWFAGSVTSSAQASGGIVGRVKKGNVVIENCLYSGKLENTLKTNSSSTNIAYAGGVIGWVLPDQDVSPKPTVNVEMNNCLVVGSVKAAAAGGVGSVVGRARDTVTFTNVYTTDKLEGTFDTKNSAVGVGNYSSDKIVGAPVLKTEADLKDKSGFDNTQLDFYISGVNESGLWVARKENYPALKSFVESSKWNEVEGLASAVRVSTDWYTPNEDENVANVYNLSTDADLYGFAKLVNEKKDDFKNDTINLTQSITINESGSQRAWTPIGTSDYGFAGTFNGNGYTISGVYCVVAKNAGLFGNTTCDSVITNFTLKNSRFETTSGANIGSVAASAAGTIDSVKCDETVSVISKGANCGGIVGVFMIDNVGDVPHKINNCWFAGTVTSSAQYSGGIVGRVLKGKAVITNCLFSGTVESTYSHSSNSSNLAFTGGLVGGVNGGTAKMSGCLVVGTVKAAAVNAVGSVLGRASTETEFQNVYTTDTLVALNGVTFNTKNGAVGVGNYSNTKITGAPIKKSADELKGKAVALDYYDAGSNEEGAWVARDNDYPVLKSFAEN